MESSAAASDEGCRTPIWSATTNWIADGSLDDAISFDSSEEIENDQVAKPVLLLRPEDDDPPPCEVTICFRQKHEIYRVYVRSTARVYEIYYSSDHQDSSMEYLCTVRCGVAVREVLPESVNVGDANGHQESHNNGIAAILDKVTRKNSNSSDDGWVQVKAPIALLHDDKEYSMSKKCDSGMDSPKMQIHYEATAEISDSAPCVSLTVRLLSIQTKACVHVEEIYVYADPVESSDSNPPVAVGENVGQSSLLAMLVPSLMQLSKSETSQTKCLSKETTMPKYQYGTEATAHTASLGMKNSVAQETHTYKSPDKKLEQTEIKSEEVYLESNKEVTVPHQMSNSFADQSNNQAYNRLQKVLDELVLKVGRVETFCSKFEENMLKPLSFMKERLQQLEQKLDALAVNSQSSEQCHCSRISASESNGYDAKNGDGNIKDTESVGGTSSVAVSSPVNAVEPSVGESQTRPGLIIKAPEFLNEDDDCSNTGDTADPFVEDFHKSKKPVSIDSALASSLAAFLTSTTVKSLDPIPSQMTIPPESVNSDNCASDTLVSVPSGVICDSLGATRKRTCFCDSLVCSRNLEIVNNENSSDMKNKDRGKPDMVTKGTSLDSSVVVNLDVLSPACPCQASSGSIVGPSEFLNTFSSNCNDTLNSPELDCLRIPPTTEQCPKIVSVLYRAPSGISSIGSNDLSASTSAICYGADVSRIENQEETEMKDEVYMSHLEDNFEQVDHGGIENSQWLSIDKADGDLGANLHDCTLADSSDAEKAALYILDPHPHSRELIEDRGSTSSSFHENDSIFDLEKVFNVKFTSQTNWISALPLELLLNGMPDDKLPVNSTVGGDEEQLHNSLSSGGVNCEGDDNGDFTSEVSSHPENPLNAGN